MPSILDIFSLASKTIVVTGATGGIGVEISAALAGAGADIISLELPNDPLSGILRTAVEKTGRKLTTYECNVRDDKSIKSAFAEMWKAGIIPDVLVNAAGITRIKPVEETTVADIDSVMEINFRGTFLAAQEFGKELLRLGRTGKIINFGSMAATVVQTDISVYSPSKAAVKTLTTAISNEWAGRGITCNAICPGFINTEMTHYLYADEQFSAKVRARTAMGRWGNPEDLSGLMVFLSSSASDFITGESIVIDGGVTGM